MEVWAVMMIGNECVKAFQGLNRTTNGGNQFGQRPWGKNRGGASDVGNDNIKERIMLRLSTSQAFHSIHRTRMPS
jgi:hypothetical protein